MPNWTNNSLSHHCCGWPFFIKAAGRYSIGKHLIDRIRALESPPNTPSDPPPPNHTIDKVLEIMGAIAANMKRINGSSGCSKAEALIEKNWTSTFGPWVRFLLQNVILAPEGPSDVSGVDRLENAFLCIPGLLTFSTDQDSSTSKIVTFMASVRCTSPEVPHLITQTWIKVLGDHHPTWGDWTYLMTTVVHSLVESEPCSKRPDIPSSGLCEGDHQIGLDFISHINHQTQRMLKMSWGEMHSFRLSLALMNDDTFTNDCPLYLESLRPYSLPAVIKLLSSALRRRRETSEVPPTTSTDSDTGFDKCAYDIGIFATLFLIRMIKDHHWVVEALRHGIVNAIFNIHPFFFQYEVRVKRRDVTLAEVFTTMFLRISGFLVYHSALHQFSRVDRKIRASHEMEKRLKSSCKELYDAWKHAQENASILRALRHAGKEDGCLTLCSSIQCPEKCVKTEEETVNVQYLRCAACTSVMYCSRSCQRFDWKDGHREQCMEIVKSGRTNGLTLSEYDDQFFRFWIKNFIVVHHKHVEGSIGEYLAELKRRLRSQSQSKPQSRSLGQPITTDQQMILDGIRNPILFMDFLGPDSFPFPDECINILDPTTIATSVEPPLDSESLEDAISEWRISHVGVILVVAMFPKRLGTSWSITMFLEYPFRLSEFEDGDGDEESGDQDSSDEDDISN